MDFILILVVLIVSLVVVKTTDSKLMNVLFSFVTMFIGMNIFLEGIVWDSSTLISSNSTYAFILFLIVTFGSVINIFTILTERRR